MKRKLLFLLYIFLAVVAFETLLIVYNHFTGFSPLSGLLHFTLRLFNASLVVTIIMAILLPLDMRFIDFLESRFPWQHRMWSRITLDILGAMSVGITMGVAATTLSWLFFGYDEPLKKVYLYNGLIGTVLNILVMAALESIRFYRQNRESQYRAEMLERENIGLRFETLKKQLDPHFLFNSLNVLSSLIRKDREQAQAFIDEFSAVYRYTLDVIDQPVVRVTDELQFAHSYFILQNMRFKDAVTLQVNVDPQVTDRLLPPLSVQTLLENAFKHNIANPSHPMHIQISNTEQALVVSNTLQLKKTRGSRRGLGFENLKSRYALISGNSPEVMMTERDYIVKLPFVEVD